MDGICMNKEPELGKLLILTLNESVDLYLILDMFIEMAKKKVELTHQTSLDGLFYSELLNIRNKLKALLT